MSIIIGNNTGSKSCLVKEVFLYIHWYVTINDVDATVTGTIVDVNGDDDESDDYDNGFAVL